MDFANDALNCGGCGKDCESVDSNQCAQSLCQNAVFEDSTYMMACSAVCAAHGGTCGTECSLTLDGSAEPDEESYQCGTDQPFSVDYTCTDVPTTTSMGCPAYGHVCCCDASP